MELERKAFPLRPKDPERRLEDMLKEFPEENLVRIEARIEGKPLAEQIEIVEDTLKKRRESIGRPRYKSDRLRMIERVSDEVFERLANRQENQVEVGRVENGRVFEYQAS